MNFAMTAKNGASVVPLDGFEPSKKLKELKLIENLNLGQTKNAKQINSGRYRSVKHSSTINNLQAKGEIKHSVKWGSYGGCIPSILQALETIDDLDEALKPWEESLNRKEMTIILKEQSDWERALEIFQWFQRKGCYEVNVIHYNIMLKVLGKSQRWDWIEKLWDEMDIKGLTPTNSTYGTLVDVYSKAGLKEQALMWLDKMRNQGLQPDEITMGIVVQMYKKAREFDKAKQFFETWSSGKFCIDYGDNCSKSELGCRRICEKDNAILSMGSPSKEQGNQLEPRIGFLDRGGSGSTVIDSCYSQKPCSSYTYNTLIDTYGKAGQLKEASEAFARMLSEGIVPNTVTFNTMIHVCGNHGRIEEADALMAKMEELRCFPDTRTYNILISLHAKNDNIGMAAGYFAKMKVVGLEPDFVSYRTLVYAFSIRLMVQEVEALVLEMDERSINIDEFTQSALTRMYIDAGMLERSWAWFERFHLSGEMSSECYSANIDAFGERGYWSEAEKVFTSCLIRKDVSVLEFNVMIKACGIAKKYDKACEVFDSMENYGVFPDKCTYNSLIQILSNVNLPYKANFYLNKMQEAQLTNDCIPYCAVISSFARLGQTGKAEELYEQMVGCGLQPDIVVFGVLINAFAEVGNVKKAMHYVNSMKDVGFPGNVVIYNSLIKLYTKVGYLQEAQETYELLKFLKDPPDIYSSNCMIDLYSKRNMVRQAEEIFEDLKQRGEANEFSFAMMLCLYKKVGRFSEAVGIAQEMHQLGLLTDILSYNNVIGLYASDGRLKEAVETFHCMMKLGIKPNDSTFKLLGAVLVKLGAPKEAVYNLEFARRKNYQSGMYSWVVALRSMVGLDVDAPKLHDKLKYLVESSLHAESGSAFAIGTMNALG